MRTIVGLDTAETAGKTVAVWDNDKTALWDWKSSRFANVVEYDSILDVVADPVFYGCKIVVESSAASFEPTLRPRFIELAKKNNIELYPINSRHTKNRRKDHNIEKGDFEDAWVLLNIGKEGIIPRCKFVKLKQLSREPLILLRQLKYNASDPRVLELIPDFTSAIAAVEAQSIPDCAITCGAGKQLKKSRRYELGYRFYTPIIAALVVLSTPKPSYRKLKARSRLRGLDRSNMKFHPLKGLPYSERKEIMNAQNAFARFVFDTISATRHIRFTDKTVSRSIREAVA